MIVRHGVWACLCEREREKELSVCVCVCVRVCACQRENERNVSIRVCPCHIKVLFVPCRERCMFLSDLRSCVSVDVFKCGFLCFFVVCVCVCVCVCV